MGTRAALYCRVSTSDQRHDLQTSCASTPGYGASRSSGSTRTRSRAAETSDLVSTRWSLMRGATGSKTVLVWKLDRLGRSLRHLVLLLEELSQCGVSVVATSQGIDTSGALGRFVANLLGALGEMERELIVERTRAGLAAAKRRGVRFGRPSVLSTEAAARVARLH